MTASSEPIIVARDVSRAFDGRLVVDGAQLRRGAGGRSLGSSDPAGRAYALPVTHGIATLQQLMLRGVVIDTWMLAVLLAIGVVLYVFSLLRLRRVIRTAD